MSVQRGKTEQRFDYIEIAFREDSGSECILATAVRGERLTLAILASEQPVGEREIGDEGNARLLALRQNVGFWSAMEQAVFVLHADKSRRAGFYGGFGLAKLVCREIGTADFADLAGFHKIVKGP